MRTPSALLPDRAPGRPSSPALALAPGLRQVTGPLAGHPVGLSLSWRTRGEYTVAALTGELDIACAATLRDQLLGLLSPGSVRLVVDLAGVSYCDASGLSVLVVTGRRAELLGGVLRLAAAAPAIASALRALGLHRRFDVFASVQAATAATLPGQPRPARALPPAVSRNRAVGAVGPDGPVDPVELRAAVAALLSSADAWRDADPDRRFTAALQALSRAYARTDNAVLTEAACTLLSVLTEHPLTYTPSVAATASRLRRLLDAG
jgi:anti-anti-sigma factor